MRSPTVRNVPSGSIPLFILLTLSSLITTTTSSPFRPINHLVRLPPSSSSYNPLPNGYSTYETTSPSFQSHFVQSSQTNVNIWSASSFPKVLIKGDGMGGKLGGSGGGGMVNGIPMDSWTVRGKREFNWNLDYFSGIPFAQPPTGTLRFLAPKPMTFAAGDYVNASDSGPACPQVLPNPNIVEMSEDCLRLNVIRPANLDVGAKLPVFVWMYGGGFEFGWDGQDPGYIMNRSMAIGKPFIFVAFNYRTNSLGFLSHPSMSASDLNAGIKDQVMALQWVNNNIAWFGGDPSKVTIGGQSAGAMSTAFHLLFGNTTLFRGGVMSSGSPTSFPTVSPADAFKRSTTPLISYTTCSTSANQFQCLQNLSISDLIAATKSVQGAVNYPFYPIMDGDYFTASASSMLAGGKVAKVPTLMGNVLDEGTLFIGAGISSINLVAQTVMGFVPGTLNLLTNLLNPLLLLYPTDPAQNSPFGTGDDLFGLSGWYKYGATVMGDVLFQSGRRLFAQTMTKQGAPVWSYIFTVPDPNALPYLGVTHSADLLAVFGFRPANYSAPSSFVDAVQDYFIRFIVDQNPNAPGQTFWPEYGTNQTLMVLNPALNLTTDSFRSGQIQQINNNNDAFSR